MRQPVGRACPQRAESDVFHARGSARRDGLALPLTGSRDECMVLKPRQLPMNRSFGPWPLGRFNAGLRRVRGNSLKAAVRTVFGSMAMCMAQWRRQLPVRRSERAAGEIRGSLSIGLPVTRQTGFDHRGPKMVAVRVQVQPVVGEKLALEIPLFVEHRRKDIDEIHEFIPRCLGLEQRVGAADSIKEMCATDAGFDRNERDARVRQASVNGLDQLPEVRENLTRRAAAREVVFSGIQKHYERLVRENDPIRVGENVGHHRPAKASPHDRKRGEILFQRLPQPDA